MVAILRCDLNVMDRLDRGSVDREFLSYSEAWRRGEWEGAKPHLAILVLEGEIRWIGKAQGGRPITTRDRIVKCSELEEIRWLPLAELRANLPARHAAIADRIGILPSAGGAALISALTVLRPELAESIARLQEATEISLPVGNSGEILDLQRDGICLALEVSGIGRQALRTWSAPAGSTGLPFLAGLPGDRSPLEDHLINHDVGRLPGLAELAPEDVAWRTFTDGRRRLFVMNANRTAVEWTLGVDVVYYNEDLHSFVMVQYKKMTKERSGKDRYTIGYRPDSNLRSELERMAKIDRACSGASGDFRLLSTPCWLKLCVPTARLVDPASLTKGMYLPREHFETLQNSCRGPRGGVRLTFENVPRHFSNTGFIDLLREGWIGSRGAGSEQIAGLVEESLSTGHAVVYASDGSA